MSLYDLQLLFAGFGFGLSFGGFLFALIPYLMKK